MGVQDEDTTVKNCFDIARDEILHSPDFRSYQAIVPIERHVMP